MRAATRRGTAPGEPRNGLKATRGAIDGQAAAAAPAKAQPGNATSVRKRLAAQRREGGAPGAVPLMRGKSFQIRDEFFSKSEQIFPFSHKKNAEFVGNGTAGSVMADRAQQAAAAARHTGARFLY